MTGVSRMRATPEEGRHKAAGSAQPSSRPWGGLSTGVMALDGTAVSRTANRAAEQILGVSVADLAGRGTGSSAAPESLQPFVDRVMESFEGRSRGARRDHAVPWWPVARVLCAGTLHWRRTPARATGHVLVFDDVTELLKLPSAMPPGAGGAAPGARDREPADADPVVNGRAPAPQIPEQAAAGRRRVPRRADTYHRAAGRGREDHGQRLFRLCEARASCR